MLTLLALTILLAQARTLHGSYVNVTTVAGIQGTAGYNGDNIQGTSAHLYLPSSVMSDLYNNLIITDSANFRIRKLDVGTGIMTTIAGTGTAGTSADGTEATSAKLQGPLFSAIDSNGNIYICSTGGNSVQKITAGSSKIYTFAGNGMTSGDVGDEGPATGALLYGPRATAVDDKDNLLISERDGNRVRRVDTVGIIHAVAGTGASSWNGDGLAATATNLNSPRGLYYDASSTSIYLAETGGCRIRKFSLNSAGNFISSTYAGRAGTSVGASASCGDSGDGGPATSAQLYQPRQIVMDLELNLYICDTQSNKIRKVTASTGIITAIAGTGTAGYNGNQAATASMLNSPFGVWVDAHDNIFIADRINNIIRTLYSSSPTARPTGPTQAPSCLPTRYPSTSAPTSAAPSVEPTIAPSSVAPTATPTDIPISSPSIMPTATSTATPSETPTILPTAAPSTEPSTAPTISPTAAPTTMPYADASTAPSAAAPTGSSSAEPSPVPTSAHPSQEPTSPPTNTTGSLLSLESTSSNRSFDSMTLALIIVGLVSVAAVICYFWMAQRSKKGSDSAYDRWNRYQENRKKTDIASTNYESDEDDATIHYDKNPLHKTRNKYVSGVAALAGALGLGSSKKKKKLAFPSDKPSTVQDHETYMASIESHITMRPSTVDRITAIPNPTHVVDVDRNDRNFSQQPLPQSITRVYRAQQPTLQDNTVFHATVNPLLKGAQKARVVRTAKIEPKDYAADVNL